MGEKVNGEAIKWFEDNHLKIASSRFTDKALGHTQWDGMASLIELVYKQQLEIIDLKNKLSNVMVKDNG